MLEEEILTLERSPMHILGIKYITVMKPNKLRILTDLKGLNRVMKRSRYPIFTTEEVATKISHAKVFLTLDTNSGFWHVSLHDESIPGNIEYLELSNFQ